MVDVTIGEESRREPRPGLSPEAEPVQRPSAFKDVNRYHVIFAVAAFVYLFLCISCIDLTYIDFGDGNYLYLSWRMAEGDRLYADLPSPQPPMHLLTGCILVKMGGGSLVLVRTFQAVLRILTAGMVWLIARQITKSRPISALAGIIYIWLPEGVWWSRGYQSEPLVIFILCCQLYFFLRALDRSRPGLTLIGAGTLGSLAVFTNMTAVPYLGLQFLYLIYHYRPRFIPFRRRKTVDRKPIVFWLFLFSFAVPCVLLFIMMNIYSNGQYLDQIWSRQVGTFPTESVGELLHYVISSLIVEGGDIATYEGGFVLLAVLGVLLFAGMAEGHTHLVYILWWALASFGSIIFVAKGGTVEYIFTLGEPAVAVFSAFFLHNFVVSVGVPWKREQIRTNIPLGIGKILLVLLFLIPTLTVKGGWLVTRTMQNSIAVFEFPEEQVKAVLYTIEKYAKPDDKIICPPFYAYAAHRELAAHLSYDFILAFAYYHEYDALVEELGKDFGLPTFEDYKEMRRTGEKPSYGAAAISRLRTAFEQDPSLHEKYSAISMFLEVNRLLYNQQVPIVITNRSNLVTWVPLLYQPIRDRYQVLDLAPPPGHPLHRFYDPEQDILRSREERLQFFVPRGQEAEAR